MRYSAGSVVTGILLSLASAHAAEPRDSGIVSPLESLPQSIWRVDGNSTAHHLQTGLQCPFTAGAFALERVMSFDPGGLDVACNYIHPGGGAVTIYLTMRGEQSVADDLARADSEITLVHPDWPVLDDAELPEIAGETMFIGSLYSLPAQQAHSGIWVGDYSGWTVKFRATYAAGAPQDALDAIQGLIETAAPARLHLLACAEPPATERTGQIKDDDALPIMGAMLLAAHAELQAEPAATIWCAESLLSVTRIPLLLWRNIGESSASKPVLRVSGGTNGPPPIIEVVESGLGALTNDGLPDDIGGGCAGIHAGRRAGKYAAALHVVRRYSRRRGAGSAGGADIPWRATAGRQPWRVRHHQHSCRRGRKLTPIPARA